MKIASATNLVIRSFLTFIIVYLWASFYIKGFIFSFLVSVMAVVTINYLVKFFSKRNTLNKVNTKNRDEHISTIILQLKFMTKIQTLTLLKAALCEKFKCLATTKKLTIWNTDNKKIDIFTLFHKGTPTETDIIDCLKANNQNTKTFIAAEHFTPQVQAFVRLLKIDVQLLDGLAVYNQILAPSQTFPQTRIEVKKHVRLSFRELKQIVFSRERTKTYVITAVVILFSSLIIKFSIYYIIIATIVFGLALSSYFTPVQKKNLFE